MTLRQYFLILAGGTVFALASFVLLLLKVNPETASGTVFAIFYGSLFLGLTGVLAMLGAGLRIGVLHKHAEPTRQVLIATRQGGLLSLLIALALWLQSRDMLAWWSLLLMVFLVTLLELVFISARFRR
jgi:hypothetical protein